MNSHRFFAVTILVVIVIAGLLPQTTSAEETQPASVPALVQMCEDLFRHYADDESVVGYYSTLEPFYSCRVERQHIIEDEEEIIVLAVVWLDEEAKRYVKDVLMPVAQTQEQMRSDILQALCERWGLDH